MKLKYNGKPDMKTERIRAILSFRQFIENKIIREQVHYLNYKDLESRDGFSRFMAFYLK